MPISAKGSEAVEGIHFALGVGASVSGRVVDAESGLPLAGRDVSAGAAGGQHLAWSRTDSDGNYTLRGLPDGMIGVVVSGQGYTEQRRTVTIRNGEHVPGVDF